MIPSKVFVCFLLVLTIICVNPMLGECFFGTKCTNQDKRQILYNCVFNLKKSNPDTPPPRGGLCCNVVRELRGTKGNMMKCIAKLLTKEEKEQYDVTRIQKLKSDCSIGRSSSSLDEVKS
ncbi:hypothetical protein HU200_016641 [Digitaria exilis]|uniref:Bifunctional inhibitor/plant lipid transfer protein/seed storage helical domain-containing protein n=1 Tax=Digitaria exilis TaxID=1010633 RepID=A0A835KI17_9POAL|nr:hypothetical protein HU200_016641 [Digitaria exilis]